LGDAQRESIERMVALIEVDWENPAVSNLLAENDDQLEGRIQGEQLRRAANGDAVAGFIRAMLRVDVSEQARGITVPTLVIQGKADTQTPRSRTRRPHSGGEPGDRRRRPLGGYWYHASGAPAYSGFL
jgi:pimeloyl-ACP methyl ester carboxylesterase